MCARVCVRARAHACVRACGTVYDRIHVMLKTRVCVCVRAVLVLL